MTSLDTDIALLGDATGKVVLITGGASGIGRAAAELFHAKGAKVVIGDLDQKLGIEKNCTFQVCNVASWSSLYALFDTAFNLYEKIDIVLANAGVAEIEDVFTDVLDEKSGRLVEPRYTVLDIDLKGVLNSRSPGAIVLTSSIAGVVGDTYLPVYSACKHGVIGLTRSLSAPGPFIDSGIRMNCVAPFMTESGFITSEMRPHLEAMQLPINKASSVAKAIAYLALTDGVIGRTIYIADDGFTETEGPLRRLRPQWLGERLAALLEHDLNGDMMTSGHMKV